jgi:phosphotransferase system enzyme I (PtsP)
LSLSPSAIGPVKALLLETNARKAADMLYPLVEKPVPGASIRERLTQFAEAEGLAL